jgi:hypothetical protein
MAECNANMAPFQPNFALKTAFRHLSVVLPGFDSQPPAGFAGVKQT